MPTLSDVERLDHKPRQALADSSYASRANVAATIEAQVDFLSPPPDPQAASRAAERAAGIVWEFRAQGFEYDEKADLLRCQQGKELAFQRRSTTRERRYRQYQAQGSDCRECPSRLTCCPKSWERGRTVSRLMAEDALMAAHRNHVASTEAQAAYRKRSEVAEFPTAWLKERSGLRKFRWSGLRKARDELLWALLSYNVAHWIRLVWSSGVPASGPAAVGAA